MRGPRRVEDRMMSICRWQAGETVGPYTKLRAVLEDLDGAGVVAAARGKNEDDALYGGGDVVDALSVCHLQWDIDYSTCEVGLGWKKVYCIVRPRWRRSARWLKGLNPTQAFSPTGVLGRGIAWRSLSSLGRL